jgi:hypothetical protein
MANPACTVQDGVGSPVTTTNGVDVTPGDTITIQLADVSGVETWSIDIVGTDELVAMPALTRDNVNKKATFVAPVAGSALLFESAVTDTLGVKKAIRFEVHTLASGYRVMAGNERSEASAAFGWIKKLNAAIRAVAAAAASIAGQAVVQLPTSGGDAAYQITGTNGNQLVPITALTAPHAWTMPTAPTIGMSVSIADARKLYTAVNKITLGTAGGTDHFWVNGVDKGTTYVIDPTLWTGNTITFTRLTATTWEVV